MTKAIRRLGCCSRCGRCLPQARHTALLLLRRGSRLQIAVYDAVPLLLGMTCCRERIQNGLHRPVGRFRLALSSRVLNCAKHAICCLAGRPSTASCMLCWQALCTRQVFELVFGRRPPLWPDRQVGKVTHVLLLLQGVLFAVGVQSGEVNRAGCHRLHQTSEGACAAGSSAFRSKLIFRAAAQPCCYEEESVRAAILGLDGTETMTAHCAQFQIDAQMHTISMSARSLCFALLGDVNTDPICSAVRRRQISSECPADFESSF